MPRALPKKSQLVRWLKAVPFLSLHVACLAVFFTGVHALDVVICVALYFVRMFGITAGYHRYFAHRAYKAGRVVQFGLAWLGCMAMQKGPLWWAAHHRDHHRYSDTEDDPHSPITKGVWWSHVGWVLDDQFDDTNIDNITAFARYPALRLMNTLHWVPGLVLAVMVFLVGGFSAPVLSALGWIEPTDVLFSWPRAWSALVVGFLISTVLLYHGVFCVNSMCHIFGCKRYVTGDESRNNWWVALFTMGEGWHNNHHYYQSSANQGFFWWEIDGSYYIIQAMAACGLVWDVRKPPEEKLYPERAIHGAPTTPEPEELTGS